jgi:hypothetical protein
MGVHRKQEFWTDEEKLDDIDMDLLKSHFCEKEVKLAIDGMRTNSALGPNGFTILFSKNFGRLSRAAGENGAGL